MVSVPLTWSDLGPVVLSIQLALVTTVILFIFGVPIAWWLAQRKTFIRGIVGAVITLPLVLPPSVLGFYVLIALGPEGPLGRLLQYWGIGTLNFTFTGLVIGSVIYSLPFMIQPVRSTFESIGSNPIEVAQTLGIAPWKALITLVLPMASHGLLTGILMTFSHTIGRFGVVLMIGGNIPGSTQVVSTEIFTFVEALEYEKAHWLSGGMLLFSFLVLMSLHYFEKWQAKGVAK